jgi:hypothetical protein
MKLMSALRGPCHSRMASRTGAGPMDDGGLQRTMLLTQGVVLALCAARVVSDLKRGPLSIEGDIALVLLVILTISLMVAGGSAVLPASPPDAREHAAIPSSKVRRPRW